MMTRYTLLLLSLLFVDRGFSQKQTKDDGTYPWNMLSTLYTSDSTGIILPLYDKNNSIYWINQNATVNKELPLPGPAFGISKWRSNILVFCTQNSIETQYNKKVHALMIDNKTKTILWDKVIYINPGGLYQQYLVTNDAEGNFAYVLVRTSNHSGSLREMFQTRRELRNMRATIAMTVIFLSDAGDPVVKEVSSSAIGGTCLANYANQKGEVALVTYNKGLLTAEKFGCDGQLQKALSVPFECDPEWKDECKGRHGIFKPGQDDLLIFAVADPDRSNENHRHLGNFAFDFGQGKVTTLESTKLTKDYFQQFKTDPGLGEPKHFKKIKELRPDGLLYLGDTLMISNEVRYLDNLATPDFHTWYWHSEGLIVSLYDKQYRLLHRFYLDRNYVNYNYSIGIGLSYHVRNGKILAFGSDGDLKFNSFYYILDPKYFTMEKKVASSVNLSEKYVSDTENIFWFRDSLVEGRWIEHFMANHVNTAFMATIYP
jgi:hypothetical protein